MARPLGAVVVVRALAAPAVRGGVARAVVAVRAAVVARAAVVVRAVLVAAMAAAGDATVVGARRSRIARAPISSRT